MDHGPVSLERHFRAGYHTFRAWTSWERVWGLGFKLTKLKPKDSHGLLPLNYCLKGVSAPHTAQYGYVLRPIR